MLKKRNGFTLIEILVVVLIIGILGAIALPQYAISVERTRVTANLTTLKPVFDSALQYYSFNDEFPDSLKKLPVSLPESYTVQGLSARSDDGTCNITIDPQIQAAVMECGRGKSADYKLEFRYNINESGTIMGAGKYFFVLANDDKRKTFEKVAISSGWQKEGEGFRII